MHLRALACVLPLCGLITVPARAQHPGEIANIALSAGRGKITATAPYQAAVLQAGLANTGAALKAAAADPGRAFLTDACWNGQGICAGDPRLDHWASGGDGEDQAVLYTARDGATISGHLWMTRSGSPRRPLIVIDSGSFQAPEHAYWWAAQTLARAGFVVMTFDPQTQGLSDFFGAPPDTTEGTTSQNDGYAFYDGLQDAINFALSTPSHPYTPVPSANSGTSHAAKQALRVTQGLDNAYDPYWQHIDPSEVGLAGHSAGSQGASWEGQADPRIKAIVAWDNMCVPVANAPTLANSVLANPLETQTGLPTQCLASPTGPVPAITKPTLGLSGDYLFTPAPYLAAPDRTLKEAASLTYSAAGADSGEIVIRGGTHEEFSWIPTAPYALATLRGIDLAAWYTQAWFDKYLKHQPAADAMLLTNRWNDDALGAAVDPLNDPNLFSYHYLSRMDIHRADGTHVDCENLRAGCPALKPDGLLRPYRFINQVTTADGAPTTTTPTPSPARPGCTGRRTITITVAPSGSRVVHASAHIGRRALPTISATEPCGWCAEKARKARTLARPRDRSVVSPEQREEPCRPRESPPPKRRHRQFATPCLIRGSPFRGTRCPRWGSSSVRWRYSSPRRSPPSTRALRGR
jgi:hypothetical protein